MCLKARLSCALLLGLLAACDGGSGDEHDPPDLGPNPQRWTVLAGDIAVPGAGGAIAFSPTRTLRVGSTLRTYFVRPSDGRVVFAESTDGRDLSKVTPTNLQRVNTQGDLRARLQHPTVLQRRDGKYLMLYDYSIDLARQHATRIVAMTSDDGVTWANPVQLPATDLDKNPEGFYFQGVFGLVNLPDGSIRAYYTTTGRAIGSARSTDGGVTWAQDPGYRLISGKQSTGFGDPVAIVDTDGTILLYFGYVLDFNCMNRSGTAQGCVPIRLARSTDGLNFSIYSGNVLTPGSGPIQLADPDVFVGLDGRWRMLFGEAVGPGVTSARLRYAEREQ